MKNKALARDMTSEREAEIKSRAGRAFFKLSTDFITSTIVELPLDCRSIVVTKDVDDAIVLNSWRKWSKVTALSARAVSLMVRQQFPFQNQPPSDPSFNI